MKLLCPKWLITMDEPVQALENKAVLINTEGLIKEVGTATDLLTKHPEAERIDLPDQVLMPGLINVHTHAAMTLLRGAADDLPLHEWLQNRIWPIEGALADAEFVFDGAVLGCAEMLRGGTTTFNDMYFYPEQTVAAALGIGIRVFAGIMSIEFPTRYGTGPDDYIEKGLQTRDQFNGEPTVHWTVAPHAPYTVGDDTFRRLGMLAEELDLPIHCHLHETASEVSDSVSRCGLRPFERLEQLGLINERFLAVHGVHLNESELDKMARRGATLVHCPASNLKLASGLAPTAAALSKGVRVVLGTDGAASNNKLDLWEEARMGSLLAKGVSLNATAWPAAQVLKSLTCDAAAALGMEQKIGSIREGMQADLISIAMNQQARQSPVNNVVSKLAYSGFSCDVQHVWVRGRQVVNKQHLLGKAAELEADTLRKAARLWQTRIEQVD